MKRDPYALIREALARRVAGTVIRPLPPIVHATPILPNKRRKLVHLSHS